MKLIYCFKNNVKFRNLFHICQSYYTKSSKSFCYLKTKQNLSLGASIGTTPNFIDMARSVVMSPYFSYLRRWQVGADYACSKEQNGIIPSLGFPFFFFLLNLPHLTLSKGVLSGHTMISF